MSDVYVLRKNGMYYGHNSCGYVHNVFNAELYDKDYAVQHATRCAEVTAVPISELISNTEEIQEHIDRLEVMRDAINNTTQERG